MHIHLEAPDNNTIRSYSNEQLTIGSKNYENSVIISRETIISPWSIHSVQELNETTLEPILQLKPEIIIIGHQQAGMYIPMRIMQDLSKQSIGVECMSIGAASRTYNVLLSEGRNVIVGIIFHNSSQ